MLGQPISMLIPEVIGFKMTGRLREGVTATDLVLTVTQMLRKKGVVGKFVEFYAGSFGSRLFEDGERLVAMFGEVLLALDGTVPPASMDGEGGVSQGGEGLGGVAGSGAAGVLAAGPIADVVQAVLDSPMPSRDVEQ
jgi:hypothetical protein